MIDQDTLQNQYWLKKELIGYCTNNGLSTAGSKNELMLRIETYLASGHKLKPALKKPSGQRDSFQPITPDTLVIHYKNDAATRLFFEDHIGPHFRFNAYLRQFTSQDNITKNLTYGDLINGWLAEEARRNHPDYQSSIAKQFEYNQFIKDFFAHEKGKSQSHAITAWKITKTLNGPKTYTQYKSTLLAQKKL